MKEPVTHYNTVAHTFCGQYLYKISRDLPFMFEQNSLLLIEMWTDENTNNSEYNFRVLFKNIFITFCIFNIW